MVVQSKHTGSGEKLDGIRVLVVEARYYGDLADELLAGARSALDAAGAAYDVMTVDGALELPVAISLGLARGEANGVGYAAAVVLGCVIRGDTGHYDIVAGESARALMDLSLARGLPIGNGILTVETEAQAYARARVSEMNKGGGAAEAALSVLRALRKLTLGLESASRGH